MNTETQEDPAAVPETAPAKYHWGLRLMHWSMALLIIGLIAVGWYMEDLDPKVDPIKYTLYGWHKSFGVLVLGLLVLRAALRLGTRIPPLPAGLHRWESVLSHFVHGLLYFFMLAIPISGYLMSDAGDYGVKFFGIVLPDFIPKNKPLGGIARDLHEIFAYTLLAVLALHIAGALKHRFIDAKEDKSRDVLRRMV